MDKPEESIDWSKIDQSQLDRELGWLVAHGTLDQVKLLLQHGADPHGAISHGDDVVGSAIQRRDGNSLALRALIATGRVNLNAITTGRLAHSNIPPYPLDIAIEANRPEMVEALLDGGADPNIRNKEKSSFLFRALREGNSEAIAIVIIMLLAAGADPSVKANIHRVAGRGFAEETPLDYARHDKNGPVIHVLEHTDRNSLLRNAMIYDVPWAVRRLVNRENVNQPDEEGMTPLAHAIQNDRLPIVQMLIEELGADVNLAFGRPLTTPLQGALNLEYRHIADYLRAHGAEEAQRAPSAADAARAAAAIAHMLPEPRYGAGGGKGASGFGGSGK